MSNLTEEKKERVCPNCGSKNVSITRNTHNHIKENICQDCGKSWYDKKDVKRHFKEVAILIGITAIIAVILIMLGIS